MATAKKSENQPAQKPATSQAPTTPRLRRKPQTAPARTRARAENTPLADAALLITPAIAGVHETHEGVETIDLTPPHPPREDTPEYQRAHHFLIHEKRAACEVCGVTIDTVQAPDDMETHHFPIERSYATACDPRKVHEDFPAVYDLATLLAWVDSPANLKVLCSTHHRSKAHGIHHLLSADYQIQRYLKAGYIIATDAAGLAAALATDERIEQPIEQAIMAAPKKAPKKAPKHAAPKRLRQVVPAPVQPGA